MKLLALSLLLALPAISNAATTAADLVASCEKSSTATNDKGKYDAKRPDDIYQAGQCSGFIEGWLEGMDGAFLTAQTTKLVEVSIKWNELPSSWKIAAAVQQDLRDNPLDSGKPADTILRKVLLANDLIELKPYIVPAPMTDTSQ